ncbi:unnamed protein product [Phytomonas sp. EM1]|nr:unnamed protein product [Phytomonas sp. EM1]|eukprot:CCW62782.1 unnamed protein product [Phytomonas sp. isolate EM1]
MNLTKRPPAELIIQRPDGTQTRFVRRVKTVKAPTQTPVADEIDDDYNDVMNTPLYTTSFNILLEEKVVVKNPTRFVKLVYQRMQTEGVPLDTKTYNLLMKHVVSLTDNLVFELYEKLKEEGTKENCSVQPDIETFRLLFCACERSAQYQRAFLFCQQMMELFGITLDRPLCNTLLGFCAAVQDVAQATYFFEVMKEHNVPPDVNTYNCFISVLAGSAPYAEITRVFHEMCENGIKPTKRTYNTMLKAARFHDDYEGAFQLFEEMKKKGFIPDIITYNLLLWVCQQRLDYVLGRGRYAHIRRTIEQHRNGLKYLAQLVFALLNEMEEILVTPNTFSFNKILTILLECGDVRLFKVFQTVSATYPDGRARKNEAARKEQGGSGGSPRGVVAKPTKSAAEVLDEAMCEESLQKEGCISARCAQPNLVTYKTVLKACLKFGILDQPAMLYQQLQSYALTIDKELITLLWEVCERMKNKAWADALLTEALQASLLVETNFFNKYLEVLLAVDDDEFYTMTEAMKGKVNAYGAKANTRTYNLILKSYIKRHQPEVGLRLFREEMCELYASAQPDDESYCLVLELHNLMRDTRMATKLIEDCLEANVKLGITVFEELLRIYAENDDERIEEWFNRLNPRGSEAQSSAAPPNPLIPKISLKCFATMMAYCYKRGEEKRVKKLFIELKTHHTMEADESIYSILFKTHGAKKDTKAMIAAFEEARINGIQLDTEMYNTVLAPFVEARDPFVFEVLSDMKLNGVQAETSTFALFLDSQSGRDLLKAGIARKLFRQHDLDAISVL